jgi:hypothetical protein
MPVVKDAERVAKLPALQARITALSEQQRHHAEFLPWRTDVFYYLFAALASVLISWLTGTPPVDWSVRLILTAGLCFALLCLAPPLANRLRFWVRFSWPNWRLQRKIAVLKSEVERLLGGPK